MTFEDLSPSNQVSYLEGCIPSKPFDEVTENYEVYTEDTVSELLIKSKELVKQRMANGWDHWEHLKDNTEFTEQELLNLSYRDLLYYSVAMEDSNRKTHPFGFEYGEGETAEILKNGSEAEIRSHLIEIENGETDLAFSPVGVDIWEKIGDTPTLRLAKIEDSNHIFLEYWLRTGSTREYHERRGEFIEFPTIRRVSCRLHLDEEFIEVVGRNDRERDRDLVLRYIEDLVGGEILVNEDHIEIHDSTVRYFLELDGFIRRPHSKKAGTANSRWSASDRNVSEDDLFPESRRNEEANLRFNLDSVGKVGFQLSVEGNTYRIFAQKITPQNHIKTAEFIREKIEEANGSDS